MDSPLKALARQLKVLYVFPEVVLSYDVIPCGNYRNITERSKEGHSLFNLQSIRLYDLCLRHL
ncbi:unnamed protein product [Spirodela intermedia]|uniref:Uncharacterized protein n=2 Tax=Spirodela intermedia TaxID=51605 RepID=A0A7I8LIG1_SPIIN|nr:unnamed protein product [Spirodela intermedia]CAA7409466.1 unnamed protein product [Spirodela intermedia]